MFPYANHTGTHKSTGKTLCSADIDLIFLLWYYMYKGVDILLNHYIELEIFRKTIQKLSFAYPLPLTTLYEFSFRHKRPEKCCEKDLPSEENTNGFKRYGRIFEKICTKTYSKNIPTFLVTKTKIYDKFLFESQKNIYNSIADVVGYKPITKILPKALIKSAAFLDGATPNYDVIAKEYPYYTPDKRNGVGFLEFILLLNIDLIINKRALKVLNNPIIDAKSENLAKRSVDKIIKNLRTRAMFETYVHAFLDVLEEVCAEIHDPLAEECVKKVWLTEQYQDRKNVFTALRTFLKKRGYLTKKWDEEKGYVENDDFVHETVDNVDKVSDINEKMRIYKLIDDYAIIHDIDTNFLPLTVRILFQEENQEIEKTYAYTIAEEYANIIKEYICNSINEVEKILRYLYIDDISPLRQ